MRVIAITGAMGYVGKRLLARLVADPAVEKVIGFDLRSPPDSMPAKLTYYQMDVGDPALSERLRQHRVEALVHAAFVLYPHPQRLAEMLRTNVDGTANVLWAIGSAGVHHLLVISSTTIYGAWPDNPTPLTEEDPPRPNPAYRYAVHKSRVEAMCHDFCREHPEVACLVLRPPAIMGPHFQGPMANMLAGPRALVIDGGHAPGQFLHEEDMVDFIILALRAKVEGLFNVTPDDWLPWREMWSSSGKSLLNLPWALARPFFGLLWRLGIMNGVTHPAQINLARFSFVAANGKARRELGWQPGHTTLQTVREFLNHHTR